jgi:hypothetical protein
VNGVRGAQYETGMQIQTGNEGLGVLGADIRDLNFCSCSVFRRAKMPAMAHSLLTMQQWTINELIKKVLQEDRRAGRFWISRLASCGGAFHTRG